MALSVKRVCDDVKPHSITRSRKSSRSHIYCSIENIIWYTSVISNLINYICSVIISYYYYYLSYG